MERSLSEFGIVRQVAELAASRVTKLTIAHLEDMEATLSGEGSGLASCWEEICVQVQFETSVHWDSYYATVHALVESFVVELPEHEKDALWLQTDESDEWESDPPSERDPYPVLVDDIVTYLLDEYVYAAAGSYTNERIEEFIDRQSFRD